MLDADTKRRIDTARDILVGKVPDPKSQVEQITIALIYKFMDDMDAEAEELGGNRKFFTGEYTRYGWAKLVRSGLGGHEMLNLYAEAITKMPENPGIPPLFREIFKNAFLPYRDPETLRAFLKIIDEFEYDHSERLGDAFEYLLSVLGSQGDAGQFRTPRHIIDFMVEIIDPRKTDSVLDPACGTAGFLISSYKHILEGNKDIDGSSTLTPDERGRLATNFRGYDISPDMVRLSLVNMFLHDFKDPHIFEYDTLTSQDRWNEHADVILANPPFMSPKGGIKPHNRFTVRSKRSEVLFVDYIAEHLTSNGRAGIIVPEGIIFQNQSAYIQLRKMMVNNYLVAVISLPPGVFNPYSGVKTSILILDKRLAKQTGHIGFFGIENDGFTLSAQRRPIGTNDLPQVRAEITEYLRCLSVHKSLEDLQLSSGLLVPKEKVAASDDYNLSGEHYRDVVPQTGTFPLKRIHTLVRTVTPPAKIPKTAFALSGQFPIIDQSQEAIAGWTDDEGALVHPSKPLVIFGDHTCAVKLADKPFAQGADGIKILETLEGLDPRYLFHVMRLKPLESAGYRRHFSLLKQMEIPFPPIDIQKEIVAEIEGYQRVIDGAYGVLCNYRPRFPVRPDWPTAPISKVASVVSGFRFPLDLQGFTDDGIPFLKVSDMNLAGNESRIVTWNNSVSRETLRKLKARTYPAGTVIFPKVGAAIATNKKRLLTTESAFDNNVMGIVPKSGKLVAGFLYAWLLGFELSRWASSAQPPSMRKSTVEGSEMPCPDIKTQMAIVTEIEAEQELVDANRDLITRMEARVLDAAARVWVEDIVRPAGA